MKKFTILLTIALLLGACGAQPAPTMAPADVQLTAVAAAFTIVAETHAAVPTSTPLPPTETASPTLPPTNTSTAVSLPTLGSATLGATLPPTSVAAGGGGAATPYYCETRVLSWSPKGRATTIRIANLTKAPVTVSVYLNETQDHNECGYRSYNIAKNGDVVIGDLVQGCYNLWAWSTDPQIPVNGRSETSCINNPDKWTFEIREDFIKFVGP